MYEKGQLVHTSFMSQEAIGVYLGFLIVNGVVLHRVYNLKRKVVTFYTSDELKPIGSKNEL
tara:strand:+ start:2551 stop:2733 length:183 start_codon:yes stop_codon:yes gene_type:complete